MCFSLAKTSAAVVAILLVLTPSPVHPAPTPAQQERDRRQTAPISQEALAAFNGLAITSIYLTHHPNFTTTEESTASSISEAMCDLLAYHDILADLSQNSSNTNTTTLSSAQNTTEDPVIVLLRANIEDSCVWLRLILQQSSNTAGSATTDIEEEMGGLWPASCDLEHLSTYCVVRRLVDVARSASRAVQYSIYDTYNAGDVIPIPMRFRRWIDSKVPELIPQLQMLYF